MVRTEQGCGNVDDLCDPCRRPDALWRACASGCPNTVSTDDKPAIGAVAGHIDDKIYYSKCLLAEGLERDSPKEMHCFHIIYKASDRSTYEPIVAHMCATLK